MKAFKKLTALGLSAAMILSMVSCGETAQSTETTEVAASAEKRVINIGTWYDHYYDSDNTDIYENPNVSDEVTSQMQLDKVRELETKYNVEIHWTNLTYTGVQDSINTSILAGTPDCDIYEVDLNFGIPAALNGYATDMKTVVAEDDDLVTEQNYMKYVQIGSNEGAFLIKPVSAETTVENTYPLAFNKQMLDEAGLEDPRDLYEQGLWTWDKFKEYMLKLTVDNNGDGVTDVYGFGSDCNSLLTGLLMSNGTGIAMDATQTLDSPAVGECLDFMYAMYNTDKCAYPWYADDFDTNRLWYRDGLTAFWVSAAWIMSQYEDSALEFEVCFCPWPVGPSGNKDTNKMKNVAAGNAYMIPSGVEDPALVYAVFSELMNWYNNDVEIRDGDMSWWEDSVISEENYAYMELFGSKENFDLWNVFASSTSFDLQGLVTGTVTPAQLQETYKQPYQDALDAFFK